MGTVHRLWVSLPSHPAVAEMASALGVHHLISRILLNRGITDPEEARRFLNPSLDDLLDPFVLPDVGKAINRILRAIRLGEPITVYGDYDADGVTSTAILVRTLRALGAKVWEFAYYIPQRLAEGYGLSRAAVEKLYHAGTRLLITVDCGTTAVEEIALAQSLGIDVIVLDHHEPPPVLPRAYALVNPKVDLKFQEPGLSTQHSVRGTDYCAAGLAFQLSRALRGAAGLGGDPYELVDLAAIGTIADVVPLLGDNRALAHAGLLRLSTSPVVGLEALKEVAGLSGITTARDVSHILAPRLNASGRMGDASLACALLLTDDREEAKSLALRLEEQNRFRQEMTDRVLVEALEQVESQGLYAERAIVLASRGWHPGVIGIVASRLVERFHRPAIVIALEEGVGRGSARSIPGLHLVEALSACRDHLLRFGGHALAAGLVIEEGSIPAFRERFLQEARLSLRDEDLTPKLYVDAEISLKELTPDLARQVLLLRPFGEGNPEPSFAARGVEVLISRPVGEESLKLALTDGVAYLEAIGFGLADLSEVLAFTGTPVDVAFTLDLARAGEGGVRLIVRDLQTPGVDLDSILRDSSLLLERLFTRAEEYLRSSYAYRIEEAETFYTRVSGVTFNGRQELISRISPGTPLRLVREPQNPYDPHAVKVVTEEGWHLGYLPARLAGRLAPAMDGGAQYEAIVSQVLGGGEGRSFGLLIAVRRVSLDGEDREARLSREALGTIPLPEAIERLSIQFLAGRPLPQEGKDLIERALSEEGAVAVISPRAGGERAVDMAAITCAIRKKKPVLLALPLASQVDDRLEILASRAMGFGLRVVGFHGALPRRRREKALASLLSGDFDLLLASWDTLYRLQASIASLRPWRAFFEVPELTPTSLEEIQRLLEASGSPVPILLAARATEETVQRAMEVLRVHHCIADTSFSTGVRIVDKRGTRDKEAYLATLLGRGESTVIFTSRREQTVELARGLREKLGELRDHIAYYHGGLPMRVREVLARLFRDGHLLTLVATGSLAAAIPPVEARHVVLASVPFTRRQMLAQGSTGSPRGYTIHLLYSPEDVEVNRAAIERQFPSREILARVYRTLRMMYNDLGSLLWPDEELAQAVAEAVPGISRAGIQICLDILQEIGVIASELEEERWRLSIVEPEERRDLGSIPRFAEGERERSEMERTAQWALGSTAQELLEALAGPAVKEAGGRES